MPGSRFARILMIAVALVVILGLIVGMLAAPAAY